MNSSDMYGKALGKSAAADIRDTNDVFTIAALLAEGGRRYLLVHAALAGTANREQMPKQTDTPRGVPGDGVRLPTPALGISSQARW